MSYGSTGAFSGYSPQSSTRRAARSIHAPSSPQILALPGCVEAWDFTDYNRIFTDIGCTINVTNIGDLAVAAVGISGNDAGRAYNSGGVSRPVVVSGGLSQTGTAYLLAALEASPTMELTIGIRFLQKSGTVWLYHGLFCTSSPGEWDYLTGMSLIPNIGMGAPDLRNVELYTGGHSPGNLLASTAPFNTFVNIIVERTATGNTMLYRDGVLESTLGASTSSIQMRLATFFARYESAITGHSPTTIAKAYIGRTILNATERNTLNTWLGGPILDNLSVPARAAYSFRKLRSAYTGALIRLRRTTDNAEADFGPGADGVVSESEVLAWVGAGNTAKCVTLYDQSGNGYHAVQTTPGNQPEVVSAGTYTGGVASTGVGSAMNIPAGATTGLTAASISTVAARLTSSYPSYYTIGSSGQDTHHPFGDFNIYTDFFALNRVSVGGATIPGIGIKHLLTETNNGTTLTVYQRNILRGSVGITFSTPTVRNFPAPTANGAGLACGNELILFASALTTTDRNSLTANQISAWSIL